MKNLERITKGAKVNTLSGYIIIGDMNTGGMIWISDIEMDEDGNEINKSDRLLSLSEIAGEMKQVDGLNHRLWYEE